MCQELVPAINNLLIPNQGLLYLCKCQLCSEVTIAMWDSQKQEKHWKSYMA